FRVHDPAFGRSLAVKVLVERGEDDNKLKSRFLEEARIMGRLQHPGIPPVHHLGEMADGRPFYAMKLIKGKTLAELLRDQRATPDPLPPCPSPPADLSVAKHDVEGAGGGGRRFSGPG